ncbi:MAG: ABC transporter permease [Nitrospinota bacterium]
MKVPRSLLFGLLVLSLLALAAGGAPWLAPGDPLSQDLAGGLAGPTRPHPLGQDKLGRDILSRVLYGAGVSLGVSLTVVLVSSLIGVAVGALAGYAGGWTDELLMRLTDILLAFPGILLAIALMAVLGPGVGNVVLALCLMGWVGYARLVRGQILTLKGREFVAAAQAAGAGPARTVARHLLPNAFGPVLVQATFGLAAVILAEAGLSFLGLGVQPPTPSWGAMLSEGKDFLLVAPHLTLFPGLAIMLAVLGFNFLGDGLRDLLDPAGRR